MENRDKTVSLTYRPTSPRHQSLGKLKESEPEEAEKDTQMIASQFVSARGKLFCPNPRPLTSKPARFCFERRGSMK
jgi:hypothetical protein